MKRIMNIMKFTIIAMVMLCMSFSTVYAVKTIDFAAVLTASKETVNPGETVEVTIAVGEFADVGEGINSFMGELEYDTTKLSVKSEEIVSQNGWDTPTYENNKLLTTKGSMVSSSEDIIKITFVVNDDAEFGETAIILKNVEAANDEKDFIAEDETLSIEITEKTVVDDGSDDKENGDNFEEKPGTDEKDPNAGTPDGDVAGDIETPDDKKEEDNKKDEQPTTEGTTVVVGGDKQDNTTANKEIPKAGLNTMLIAGIAVITIVAFVMYRKNRKYDDIK